MGGSEGMRSLDPYCIPRYKNVRTVLNILYKAKQPRRV